MQEPITQPFGLKHKPLLIVLIVLGAIVTVALVLLAIAFFIPSHRKVGRMSPGRDIGKADGQGITIAEIHQAQNELAVLRQRMVLALRANCMEVSLAQRMTAASSVEEACAFMITFPELRYRARRTGDDIDPLQFVLLSREARKTGVSVSPDNVKAFLARFEPDPAAPIASDQRVLEEAATRWLTMLAAFDQNAAAAMQRDLGRIEQYASLQVVEFRASDYAKHVAAPDETALASVFAKYRDRDAETSEDGVGLRLPNRVRLQYLKISRADVFKGVTDTDAATYWIENRDQFQGPGDGPTSRPATRPWASGNDIDKEIRERLADQRMEHVARFVQQQMMAEWLQYGDALQAENDPRSRSAPATALGVPYHTFDFLLRIRELVQKRREFHSVSLSAVELPLYSASDLSKLTDVGSAMAGGINLAQYLGEFVEPFTTAKLRKLATEAQIPVLRVLEPLRLSARDATGNVYIVRVAAAEPARSALNLQEIRPQVEQAWRLLESMKKAREAAEDLRLSAQSRGILLAAKDKSMDRAVIATGIFHNSPLERIENLDLPDEAREQLIRAAFKLMESQSTAGGTNPVDLLELPRTQRVVVIQLAKSGVGASDPEGQMRLAQAKRLWSITQTQKLVADWFDPEKVQRRTNYQPSPDASQQPTPLGR